MISTVAIAKQRYQFQHDKGKLLLQLRKDAIEPKDVFAYWHGFQTIQLFTEIACSH